MKEKEFLNKMLYNYRVKIFDIVNSGNILNNYTKKIYVINLKKNIIRRKYILTIMKKHGINFKLVLVNKIKKIEYDEYCKYNNNISISELGCGLSHLWCLKDIIINKYKNAIIFEDDIIFHKNFEAKFFNIIQKQSYDFLMLGACDFHFSEINHKNVIEQKYRPNSNFEKVYGAHAIYYSLHCAKYMLHNRLNEFAFFDYNLNKIFEYFNTTSFICYPNLVVTEITTSDNNHIYDLFSQKENFFYTNCFTHFNFNDYNFIYLNLLNLIDESCINNFSNYKDYSCSLFKIKYPEKKYYIKKFIKRLDLTFLSWEDIKNIIIKLK
jgi:GR25 family glycosyltransferase involved in LPS biosynthesis